MFLKGKSKSQKGAALKGSVPPVLHPQGGGRGRNSSSHNEDYGNF
jgi:hypothetical protein